MRSRTNSSRTGGDQPDQPALPCSCPPETTSISSRPAHKTHALIIPSAVLCYLPTWGLGTSRASRRVASGPRPRPRLGVRPSDPPRLLRIDRTCPATARERTRLLLLLLGRGARPCGTRRLLRESSGESFSAARRERVGGWGARVAVTPPSIVRIRFFTVALGEQIRARILPTGAIT